MNYIGNDFSQGFKTSFETYKKGTINLKLDNWCFSLNEVKDKVIENLTSKGHICDYCGCMGGFHMILVDGKKYAIHLLTSGSPFQQVTLIPQ